MEEKGEKLTTKVTKQISGGEDEASNGTTIIAGCGRVNADKGKAGNYKVGGNESVLMT